MKFHKIVRSTDFSVERGAAQSDSSCSMYTPTVGMHCFIEKDLNLLYKGSHLSGKLAL